MKISLFIVLFIGINKFAFANTCYSSSQFISGIEDFIQEVNKVDDCISLDIGDAKIVDTPLSSSKSDRVKSLASNQKYFAPNASQYLLRRTDAETYDVVFNLNFNRTSTSTVSEADMLERVQRCLEISSENMYANGKKIRLIALPPNEAQRLSITPPQIDINIIANGKRGNAQNFGSDFQCGTITHELLHFLGLCDEYREKVDVNSPESICRALGTNDSIMGANMNDIFASTVGDMATCDLSHNPEHKQALQSSNPIVKEAALRKSFMDVLSIHPDNIGTANNALPIAAYCHDKSGLPALNPSSVNYPFTRVDESSTDKLVLSSVFYNINGYNSVFTASKECDCSKVAESEKEACRRFINLATFRAQTISTPGTKLYTCPSYTRPITNPDGTPGSESVTSRIPLEDLTIEPGNINLDGNKVSFRDAPTPTRRSLLHSAHLEKIIQGSCETADMNPIISRYNQCARFSRKHSHTGLACSDKPDFCDDNPTLWLGVRP